MLLLIKYLNYSSQEGSPCQKFDQRRQGLEQTIFSTRRGKENLARFNQTLVVLATCMRCHGTKCSLLLTFFPEGVIAGFWNCLGLKNEKCLETPEMDRKISTGFNGGLSGESNVHRPGSEDPHRRQQKFDGTAIIYLPLSVRPSLPVSYMKTTCTVPYIQPYVVLVLSLLSWGWALLILIFIFWAWQ